MVSDVIACCILIQSEPLEHITRAKVCRLCVINIVHAVRLVVSPNAEIQGEGWVKTRQPFSAVSGPKFTKFGNM